MGNCCSQEESQQESQVELPQNWKCQQCGKTSLLFYDTCTAEDCNASNDNLNDQCLLILSMLLPETWGNSNSKNNANSIQIERFTNALSSKVYKISNQVSNTSVVLRFYNPVYEANAKLQEMCNVFDKHLKCGPKIYGQFEHGHIEEYLENFHSVDTLKNGLKNESIYKKIAITFANIHCFDASKILTPNTMTKCDTLSFLNSLIETGISMIKDEKNIDDYKWLESYIIDHELKQKQKPKEKQYKNWYDFLDIEWKFIQDLKIKYNVEIFISNDNYKNNNISLFKTNDYVFCHCDPNPRNILGKEIIIIDETKNDNDDNNDDNDDDKINETSDFELKFIDFEFTGYNDRLWDFCHYFCEMAIDAHDVTTPPHYQMHFDTDFGDRNYREKFVKYYLNQCIKNKFSDENYMINQENIDKFLLAVDISILWCHLLLAAFFGINRVKEETQWFREYTIDRLKLYFQFKSQFLKDNE